MLNLYVKADPNMDQRIIEAHLVLKGLLAPAIHEDLTATLGSNAVA
jgi:hypothetical protein